MHNLYRKTSNSLLGLMLCTSYSFAGVMPLSEAEPSSFSKKPLVTVRIISSDSPVPTVPVLTASVAPTYVSREDALTQLTQNNGEEFDDDEISTIRAALANIQEERITETFIEIIKRVSKCSSDGEMGNLITRLGSVDCYHLTSDAVNSLSRILPSCRTIDEKILLMKILSKTPADKIGECTRDLSRKLKDRESNVDFLKGILGTLTPPVIQEMDVALETPVICTLDKFLDDSFLGPYHFLGRQDTIVRCLEDLPDNLFTPVFMEVLKLVNVFNYKERELKEILKILVKSHKDPLITILKRLKDELNTNNPLVCTINDYLFKVQDSRLTPEFIGLINTLSGSTSIYFQRTIITYLEKHSSKFLIPEFVALLKKVPQQRPRGQKYKILQALADIKEVRLTPKFVSLIEKLTCQFANDESDVVIRSLGRFEAEAFTDNFEELLNSLVKGGSRKGGKAAAIEKYTKLPKKRRTLDLAMILNKFTDDCYYSAKDAMSELIQIPEARLTPDFVDTIKRFTDNCYSKAAVIRALVSTPSERLTAEFEETVNRISNGLKQNNLFSQNYKSLIIRLSHNVSAESFAEISAYFNSNLMQDITRFLPPDAAETLLSNLLRLRASNERIAEIDRTMALYRHQGPAQPQNYGAVVGGADIHRYAQTTVFSNATGNKQALKDAVVTKLEQALNERQLVSYQSALSATKEEIEKGYNQKISKLDGDLAADIFQKSSDRELALRDKNWQHEALEAAKKDASAQKAFSLVYTLLSSEPEKLKLWMSTYFEETLNARSTDTRSCVMGMRERVITSLRSVISQIPDKTGVYKELHGLFSQVEGTVLANKFLQTINLADPNNHAGIATVLGQAGIAGESTADTAAEAYGGVCKKFIGHLWFNR